MTGDTWQCRHCLDWFGRDDDDQPPTCITCCKAGRGDGSLLEPDEIIARLKAIVAGRREYARNAPSLTCEALLMEASIFGSAIRVANGDLGPLYGLIPSWRWTPEMHRRLDEAEGDEVTFDQEPHEGALVHHHLFKAVERGEGIDAAKAVEVSILISRMGHEIDVLARELRDAQRKLGEPS